MSINFFQKDTAGKDLAKQLKELQTGSIVLLNQCTKDLNMINLIENDDQFFLCLKKYYAFLQKNNETYEQLVNIYHTFDLSTKKQFIQYYLPKNTDEKYLLLYDSLIEKIKSQTIKFNFFKEKNHSLSFCAEVLRILSTPTGLEIIFQLNNWINEKNLCLEINGSNMNLYLPQIQDYSMFNNIKIDEFKKIKTIEGCIDFLKMQYNNLFVKSNTMRNSFPILLCILSSPSNILLKIAKNTENEVPLFFCSPRYIGIAHELIHILRTLNGEYSKNMDIPEVLTFTYENAEEFIAIKCDNRYNECKFLQDLNLPLRITHHGISLDLTKDNIEKNKKLQLLKAYACGMIECQKLGTDDYSKIADNYEKLIDNYKKNVSASRDKIYK